MSAFTNKLSKFALACRIHERDIDEQLQLAKMGWHCITVWECQLKGKKQREKTLDFLLYTLNYIYLQDHNKQYALPKEELQMSAEDKPKCK